MADTRLLPFDFNAYANAVEGWVDSLDQHARSKGGRRQSLNLQPLYQAASEFTKNAHDFHGWDCAWAEVVYAQGGIETNVLAIKRMSHNTRMMNFETNLLDVDGGVS